VSHFRTLQYQGRRLADHRVVLLKSSRNEETARPLARPSLLLHQPLRGTLRLHQPSTRPCTSQIRSSDSCLSRNRSRWRVGESRSRCLVSHERVAFLRRASLQLTAIEPSFHFHLQWRSLGSQVSFHLRTLKPLDLLLLPPKLPPQAPSLERSGF